MRTGLVAVGSAFAVVGAAVIFGLLYPADTTTSSRTSLADAEGLTSGSWRPFVLTATPAASATITLDWSATTGNPATLASVNVTLYTARACPPSTEPCAVTPALVTWNGTQGGQWSASGASGASYLLYVEALGSHNVSDNFSATFVEQYRLASLPLPLVPFAVTIVGGGLLAGVGAVALYLGLFLPSGVYDSPPADEDDPDLDPIVPGAPGGGDPSPTVGAAHREN